jgi:hypothetical protein
MVPVAMTPCPVCQIPLAFSETCPSPSCPCYGMRSGSAEAESAAAAWRSRPSVAAARTMPGRAALEIIERGAWLDMMEARGRVIDVEIEHRALP